MSDIKPCPFCGKQPKILERPDSLDGFFCAISCFCGGYTSTAHKFATDKTNHENAKQQAITAWNTRFQAEPRALTLEELRERIDKPVWVETMKQWRIVIMSHDNENINLYCVYNTISAKHVLNNDGKIYDRPPTAKPNEKDVTGCE